MSVIFMEMRQRITTPDNRVHRCRQNFTSLVTEGLGMYCSVLFKYFLDRAVVITSFLGCGFQ